MDISNNEDNITDLDKIEVSQSINEFAFVDKDKQDVSASIVDEDNTSNNDEKEENNEEEHEEEQEEHVELPIPIPEELQDLENGFIHDIYKIAKLKTKHVVFSLKSIIDVVKYVMEVVENITSKTLKGKKKYIALFIIKCLIQDAPLSDDIESMLLNVLENGLIEETINSIVEATKGKLQINHIVSSGCFDGIKKLLHR